MSCAGALAALTTAMALGAALAATPVALADNGQTSLSIGLPQPSSNVARGPVGAYVSISGTGTAGQSYDLGYAAQSTGCQSGFQGLQSNGNPLTVSAAQDGSFSASFAWPDAANAVGTQYVICAQGPSNTFIQSTDAYLVVASSAPAITVQPADISTPTPGAAPTPAPRPGHLYAGSGAQITGANFAPSGTPVQLYLTFRDIRGLSPGEIQQTLQASQQLSPIGNGQLTSDSQGAFSATVALPSETGKFYVVAVSTDGTGSLPPSLQAVKEVTLQVAPQVTPTPTATLSPSPTPTRGAAGGTTSTTSAGPGSNQPAVFALGGISIILFVLGVMLLASTVAGPRPRSPQPY